MQLDKIQVVYGDVCWIDRGGRINSFHAVGRGSGSARMRRDLQEWKPLITFTPFTIPPILK